MDVLVLGNGVIGLSIALELADRGANVSVLGVVQPGIATLAAAGMLAPEAEGLAESSFLTFCLASRRLWPDWSARLGAVGYWPSGILCPQLTAPVNPAHWWDAAQVQALLPEAQVAGAYWFPEDGQVDPRRLLPALVTACQRLGVRFIETTLDKFWLEGEEIQGVYTPQGTLHAGQYVLCAGSWSAQLLDLPVYPLKGQMLALQMPTDRLDRVIFGPQVYLVPRRDGRLVVGATEERIGFSLGTTEEGIAALYKGIALVLPEAVTWPLLETWFGFRPTTPDLLPILGQGPYPNLWLASGHHRNGILLSPQTAITLADGLQGKSVPELAPFSYRRFEAP